MSPESARGAQRALPVIFLNRLSAIIRSAYFMGYSAGSTTTVERSTGGTLLGFIGRRLCNYALMLFAATTLAYFLASSLLNPRSNYMSMRPRPPEASIDASLTFANVNDKVPVIKRYAIWLRRVALDWDWGRSPQGESVNAAVGYRAVVSVKVVLGATILAIVLGVSIGVAAAIRQYRMFDRVSNAISAYFLVCPTFVLGLLLVPRRYPLQRRGRSAGVLCHGHR